MGQRATMTEFFEMRPVLAQARLGTYFMIPLRYEEGALRHDRIPEGGEALECHDDGFERNGEGIVLC